MYIEIGILSPDILDYPIKIYFVEVCYENNFFEKT